MVSKDGDLMGEKGRTGVVAGFKELRVTLPDVSLLTITIMGLIVSIAVIIRMLPIRWGFYLSEFDPYFHFKMANYIVKNGISSLGSWHDTMGWYPYGRDIIKVAFPGLAITSASLYSFLTVIGVPITLFQLCVIFPVIMASLACIAIYFLGKYIGGRGVGLMAAFFLALNAAYISRTSLGFFDDETIGVLGIIVTSYMYLRAVDTNANLRSTVIYAIGSGLTLGYVCASWGAVRYPIGMLTLFSFALILLKRYSRKLLISYTLTYGIAFLIAINVPKLGIDFLTETFNLPVYATLLIMGLIEFYKKIRDFKTRVLLILGGAAVLLLAFFALSYFGLMYMPIAKFIGVLNPFERFKAPLIESVAEHKPSAWGNFYSDFGFTLIMIPLGLYFAARDPSNKNIFMLIYGITALYFAGSMIRLMLIAAPALGLLSAFGVFNLLKPFFVNLSESQITVRERRRFRLPTVGKEYSYAAILLIFSILVINFAVPEPRVYTMAYSPTTIAAAGLPFRTSSAIPDWIEALSWMRDNLPEGSVVVSWWDYGYWITVMGNQTTVVDNATWNTTQIQNVAKIFLSNETEAIKILKKYDATHIVAFTTFDHRGRDGGWGDEGKWMWMAKIAGLNESDFGEYDKNTGRWVWNEKGRETVIYKLMNYGRNMKLGTGETQLIFFEPVFLSTGTMLPAGNIIYYPLVCIYEVRYPSS